MPLESRTSYKESYCVVQNLIVQIRQSMQELQIFVQKQQGQTTAGPAPSV